MRFAFSRIVCDVASIVTWHHLVMVRSVAMRLRLPLYPKRVTTKIVTSEYIRVSQKDSRRQGEVVTDIKNNWSYNDIPYKTHTPRVTRSIRATATK